MIEVAWHYLGAHEASLLVKRSFMSGKNAEKHRTDQMGISGMSMDL